MPTTITLSGVRRVAVGTSATAQGRDGVTELTRTALASLTAAAWVDSSAPPSMPVHDYAQALPSGDAWKACYGLDESARTERSACGAVVYTYALPTGALATGNVANVLAVTGRVTGDRYLDAGVDCHVVLSTAAEPPTVATLLARTPDATLCATGSQTQPPNQRVGVTEELDVEPSTAATAYIHVALLLHDYLGTRGAWIEGGAMLENNGRITIEFSRSVDPAPPLVSLEALRAPTEASPGTGQPLPNAGEMYAAAPNGYGYAALGLANSAVGGGLTTTDPALLQRLGSYVLTAPAINPSTTDYFGLLAYLHPMLYYTRKSAVALTWCESDTNVLSPTIGWWVRGVQLSGVFNRAIITETTQDYGLDTHLVAPGPCEFVAYQFTNRLFSLNPAMTIFSEDFWAGKTRSLSVWKTLGQGYGTYPVWSNDPDYDYGSYPPPATVNIPVNYLGKTTFAEGASISGVEFERPMECNGWCGLLLLIRPIPGWTDPTVSVTTGSGGTLLQGRPLISVQ